MLVTHSQVSWSSYLDREGPYFRGVKQFKLKENPSDIERALAVTVAVESGHYDAVNMYDIGIVSLGLIQWIEYKQFSVSRMLGEVADALGPSSVIVPLAGCLDTSRATFTKNASGKWLFHVDGVDVDTPEKSSSLFLSCSGLKGTWTAAAREHAKAWAAGLANVWSSDEACDIQMNKTASRLMNFALSGAKKELFLDDSWQGWKGALKTAYLSFAVNNPVAANSQVVVAAAASKHEKWSEGWCLDVIRRMTFGPGIVIYPIRYNAIRPVIESLWNVKMPKNAVELSESEKKPANKSLSQDDDAKKSEAGKNVPYATLPSVPGEQPGEKLVRIVLDHVGCSLSRNREKLGELVSRNVDKPEAVVAIATNCATTALGVMAFAGVRHELLNKPYVSGMAVGWCRIIGQDLGALVKYTGKSGPQPKVGSLLRYNTSGKNDDHVEWLLSTMDERGSADHGGGGRPNNAVTREYGGVMHSYGRPLVEFWDPDKLGIDVVKIDDSNSLAPTSLVPLPPLSQEEQQAKQETLPVETALVKAEGVGTFSWLISLLVTIVKFVVSLFGKTQK